MSCTDLSDLAVRGYGRRRVQGTASGKSLQVKPVPQTDTGIRDEYSEARELNLLKELDKLALYLRYKGCLARGRSEEVQPTV